MVLCHRCLQRGAGVDGSSQNEGDNSNEVMKWATESKGNEFNMVTCPCSKKVREGCRCPNTSLEYLNIAASKVIGTLRVVKPASDFRRELVTRRKVHPSY